MESACKLQIFGANKCHIRMLQVELPAACDVPGNVLTDTLI